MKSASIAAKRPGMPSQLGRSADVIRLRRGDPRPRTQVLPSDSLMDRLLAGFDDLSRRSQVLIVGGLWVLIAGMSVWVLTRGPAEPATQDAVQHAARSFQASGRHGKRLALGQPLGRPSPGRPLSQPPQPWPPRR